MKYISLFPSTDGVDVIVEAVEANKAKMVAIKAFIKEKLEAGELVKGYIVRQVNVFGGEDGEGRQSDIIDDDDDDDDDDNEADGKKKAETKVVTVTELVETTTSTSLVSISRLRNMNTKEQVQRSKTKFVHASDDEEEDAELPTVLDADDFFMTVPGAGKNSGSSTKKRKSQEKEDNEEDSDFITADEEISVRTPKKPSKKQKQKN
jgi:hypothetical protein